MNSAEIRALMNNHRMEIDGEVFIKVIDFPVIGGLVSGESMWVRRTSGDDNDGEGILDNDPAFCTEVQMGDVVTYGGGTDELKPQYTGKK